MSRKALAAFAPFIAVAAFVIAPAAAQAAPHWFENAVRIPEGKSVKVKTKGELTLTAPGPVAITCKVKDKGTIENPVGGGAGIDSITEFVNSKCKAEPAAACPTPEIIAAGLPWASELVEIAGVIRDSISGIEVQVFCGGALQDIFHGTLTPKIGESVAEFGAGSGELEDPAKNKASVTGNDSLEGPKKAAITVANP